MKKLIAAIFVTFLSISVFAAFTGVLFGPDSFKIDIIKQRHMKAVPKKDLPAGLKVDYAFTNDKKTYQLRYALYKQNEKNVTDDELMVQYSVFMLTYLYNLTAAELSSDAIQRFEDNDVKTDFNGDFGTTALIEHPKPEYCNGFKYMLVNFYCKRGHGLVVQTIVFSDVNIVLDNQFIEAFNSYKFKQ